MEKPKSKYAKSKKHKSKIKEKKREKKERQKEKKMGKNGLVHLHFFLICLLIVFLPLFCFFPGKKPKKNTKKNKSKKQKEMQMDKSIFPIFSPFLTFLFFPFILFPVFFGFEVLLFHFPCVFFFCIFSSLKNIRTSRRGENNRCPEACSVPQCHAVWLWPGRSFRALAAGRFEA